MPYDKEATKMPKLNIFDFFTKYFLIILWTLQVLQQTSLPINFRDSIYLLMGISLIFIIIFNKFILNRAFLIVHIIMLIYIVYWFLFDHSLFGLQYIVLKVSIFGLIAASLYYNFDFIEKKYPLYMLVISGTVLIVGLLMNHNFGSRYTGPFNNPNSLGFLSALAFTITLFYLKHGLKKNLLLLFFISLAFMSGSRAAVGGILLGYLLKGGISLRKILTILAAAILLIGVNQVATSYGFTTGIDRLISSSERHDLLAGRDMEFALGIKSIEESPLEGHGLDHYAHLSDRVVMLSGVLRRDINFAVNPHNSFIGLFIQLGIPFGLALLFTLIYYVGKSVWFKPRNGLFLTMMLYPFLSGFFESFLFGVNGFEGTTFWFALLYYQVYMHIKHKEGK